MIQELPETFWAYLAAFIDGEGSVTMCQNGPRLVLSNTHKKTLEWIKESLGYGYLQVNGKANPNPCYNLSFGSNPIRIILPRTIPYMRIKGKRSQVLLDYLSTVILRGGPQHISYADIRKQVKEQMDVLD